MNLSSWVGSENSLATKQDGINRTALLTQIMTGLHLILTWKLLSVVLVSHKRAWFKQWYIVTTGRRWWARARVRAWRGDPCRQVRSRKTKRGQGFYFASELKKKKNANDISRFRLLPRVGIDHPSLVLLEVKTRYSWLNILNSLQAFNLKFPWLHF